jgi:hypothetical protein
MLRTNSSRNASTARQLLLDLLDVADRRELPPEAGDALDERSEGALLERGEHLLVALVLDLVAVELAQRLAHDLALVELAEHRPHHHADGAGDQQHGEQDNRRHQVTPRS